MKSRSRTLLKQNPTLRKSSARRSSLTLLALVAWLTVAGVRVGQASPAPALTTVLPNGIVLVTRSDRTAPRTAISLLIKAGAADETMATAGWRRLLTEAMLHASLSGGTTDTAGKARTIAQLQRETEKLGGRIGADVADDVIEFWATGDSSKTLQLLDLLLNVVQHPRLADKDIDVARRRLLLRQDNEAGEIARRAVIALRSQLYRDARGELVAYGLPEYGTEESLNELTAEKIRNYHKMYVHPSRFVIAVTGDLNQAQLKEHLTQAYTTEGSPESSGVTPYFAPPNSSKPPLVVRQMQTPGAWIFISYAVPGLKDADLPAIRVLAAALGESSSARLPQRLLANQGLAVRPRASAAQVAVQYSPRRFSSEFIAFAQADPQNIDDVKNAMLDEVRKLRDAPLSKTELTRAQNYVTGNWAVEREGLRDRAYQAAFAPAVGSVADTNWPQRVAAVTTADVQRVARKYLQAYAVALIMPEE